MLDIDLSTLLWETVNFLVLFLLLYFLLFRPLKRKLNERSRVITDTLQSAQDQQAEAERMRLEYEKRLRNAQQEADEIVAKAQREAAQKSALLVREARERLDRMTEQMRSEYTRQREEIVAQNYEQILDAIIDLSGNVVQSVTTRRSHDDLVQNFLASIYQMPQEEVEIYRRVMAHRQPLAIVTTPVALTPEQSKTLGDTLSSLIDRPVEIQVRIVPELVAGIQVRIGDRLIDNSIRQQMNRIRDRVRQDLIQSFSSEAKDE